MLEAIRLRHAVRKYKDQAIEADKVEKIQQLIDESAHPVGYQRAVGFLHRHIQVRPVLRSPKLSGTRGSQEGRL